MLDGIVVLLAGLMASPQLLMAKTETNEARLKKLAPFFGISGIMIFLWGFWSLVTCFQNLEVLKLWPLWWTTLLLIAGAKVFLGGILSFFLHDGAKKVCADKASWCGILGIFLGIWYLGYYIVFHTTVVLH